MLVFSKIETIKAIPGSNIETKLIKDKNSSDDFNRIIWGKKCHIRFFNSANRSDYTLLKQSDGTTDPNAEQWLLVGETIIIPTTEPTSVWSDIKFFGWGINSGQTAVNDMDLRPVFGELVHMLYKYLHNNELIKDVTTAKNTDYLTYQKFIEGQLGQIVKNVTLKGWNPPEGSITADKNTGNRDIYALTYLNKIYISVIQNTYVVKTSQFDDDYSIEYNAILNNDSSNSPTITFSIDNGNNWTNENPKYKGSNIGENDEWEKPIWIKGIYDNYPEEILKTSLKFVSSPRYNVTIKYYVEDGIESTTGNYFHQDTTVTIVKKEGETLSKTDFEDYIKDDDLKIYKASKFKPNAYIESFDDSINVNHDIDLEVEYTLKTYKITYYWDDKTTKYEVDDTYTDFNYNDDFRGFPPHKDTSSELTAYGTDVEAINYYDISDDTPAPTTGFKVKENIEFYSKYVPIYHIRLYQSLDGTSILKQTVDKNGSIDKEKYECTILSSDVHKILNPGGIYIYDGWDPEPKNADNDAYWTLNTDIYDTIIKHYDITEKWNGEYDVWLIIKASSTDSFKLNESKLIGDTTYTVSYITTTYITPKLEEEENKNYYFDTSYGCSFNPSPDNNKWIISKETTIIATCKTYWNFKITIKLYRNNNYKSQTTYTYQVDGTDKKFKQNEFISLDTCKTFAETKVDGYTYSGYNTEIETKGGTQGWYVSSNNRTVELKYNTNYYNIDIYRVYPDFSSETGFTTDSNPYKTYTGSSGTSKTIATIVSDLGGRDCNFGSSESTDKIAGIISYKVDNRTEQTYDPNDTTTYVQVSDNDIKVYFTYGIKISVTFKLDSYSQNYYTNLFSYQDYVLAKKTLTFQYFDKFSAISFNVSDSTNLSKTYSDTYYQPVSERTSKTQYTFFNSTYFPFATTFSTGTITSTSLNCILHAKSTNYDLKYNNPEAGITYGTIEQNKCELTCSLINDFELSSDNVYCAICQIACFFNNQYALTINGNMFDEQISNYNYSGSYRKFVINSNTMKNNISLTATLSNDYEFDSGKKIEQYIYKLASNGKYNFVKLAEFDPPNVYTTNIFPFMLMKFIYPDKKIEYEYKEHKETVFSSTDDGDIKDKDTKTAIVDFEKDKEYNIIMIGCGGLGYQKTSKDLIPCTSYSGGGSGGYLSAHLTTIKEAFTVTCSYYGAGVYYYTNESDFTYDPQTHGIQYTTLSAKVNNQTIFELKIENGKTLEGIGDDIGYTTDDLEVEDSKGTQSYININSNYCSSYKKTTTSGNNGHYYIKNPYWNVGNSENGGNFANSTYQYGGGKSKNGTSYTPSYSFIYIEKVWYEKIKKQ